MHVPGNNNSPGIERSMTCDLHITVTASTISSNLQRIHLLARFQDARADTSRLQLCTQLMAMVTMIAVVVDVFVSFAVLARSLIIVSLICSSRTLILLFRHALVDFN